MLLDLVLSTPDAEWILRSEVGHMVRLDVSAAIDAYAKERRAQVSPRMVAYWTENARPLADFFGPTKLRRITPEQIAAYQNARIDAGRAPKTVNGENCDSVESLLARCFGLPKIIASNPTA